MGFNSGADYAGSDPEPGLTNVAGGGLRLDHSPWCRVGEDAALHGFSWIAADREPTRSRIVVKLADGVVTTPRAAADLMVTDRPRHSTPFVRGCASSATSKARTSQ